MCQTLKTLDLTFPIEICIWGSFNIFIRRRRRTLLIPQGKIQCSHSMTSSGGKAGMAAVTLNEGQRFDSKGVFIHVVIFLPPYARPHFVRIQVCLLQWYYIFTKHLTVSAFVLRALLYSSVLVVPFVLLPLISLISPEDFNSPRENMLHWDVRLT